MYEKFIIPYLSDSGPPLHIQAAGISFCDGSYRIQRENSAFYVLETIASGRGTLQVGDRIFYPSAGDSYLIPMHTSHCYYSDSRDPWVKYWFNVNGAAFDALVRHYELDGEVMFAQSHLGELFQEPLLAMEHMTREEAVSLAVGSVCRIVHHMYCAYTESRKGQRKYSPLALTLKDFLDRKICAPAPSLEELCKLCGKSESQMLRIFKNDFGISPAAYLQNAKLQLAQQLLSSSNLPVKELAGMLGFQDAFYFSRLFRSKLHCSPSEYHHRTFGQSAMPEIAPDN